MNSLNLNIRETSIFLLNIPDMIKHYEFKGNRREIC
ncbi:unnamed protein product, partial [marine sediment metagenome]